MRRELSASTATTLARHATGAGLMRLRRQQAAQYLEPHLCRLLAGKPLGQAIADVWSAGYAKGWRDRERERA